MPFAYITQPGTVLRKQGRKLIVQDQGETIAEFGIHQLEAIVIRGQVQITAAALSALLTTGIPTTFLSRRGLLRGSLTSPQSGHLSLRLAQYRLLSDSREKLRLSRRLVSEKLQSQVEVLVRHADNYPDAALRAARKRILDLNQRIEQMTTSAQLLGLEGQAAAIYWSVFPRMNRSSLRFEGRSRRPPRDEINALLSLGYVILTQEIRTLLEAVGFDSSLGFYHELKAQRPSLALDVLEPFRAVLIDRLVLRLVNLGRIKPRYFQGDEGRGYFLERSGWKIFLAEYEQRLLARPNGFLEDAYPQARTWRELLQKHCLQMRRNWQQQLQEENSIDEEAISRHE